METLHLTLKKEWFDMILSNEKKEEYRECKPHYHSRLRTKGTYLLKRFDVVEFRNGYAKDAPTIIVEFIKTRIGFGLTQWGAKAGETYYCIELGRILETKNISN